MSRVAEVSLSVTVVTLKEHLKNIAAEGGTREVYFNSPAKAFFKTDFLSSSSAAIFFAVNPLQLLRLPRKRVELFYNGLHE